MELLQLTAERNILYNSLWDGTSPTTTGPGTLVSSHGYIINHQEPYSTQQPSMDLSAYTLIPALIDCHIHIAMPYHSQSSPAVHAQNLLHAGVVAARDAGANEITPCFFPPLTIIPTIQAISKAGYYGENLGTPVATIQEAEDMITHLASLGAKQIKVIASGIFSFSSYGQIGPAPFSAAELTRIVQHATQHGLPVMAHASGDEAVSRCLQAGVHSIEHGYFMQRDTLKMMAEKQIHWVPTLAPVAAQLEVAEISASLSEREKNTIKRSLDRQMQLVAFARDLGVSIGAGTDAGAHGVPHGSSLPYEVSLLHQCGLTTREALMAATSTAAAICGLPDYGSLMQGKKAAILALRENPLHDLCALQTPAFLCLPS